MKNLLNEASDMKERKSRKDRRAVFVVVTANSILCLIPTILLRTEKDFSLHSEFAEMAGNKFEKMAIAVQTLP